MTGKVFEVNKKKAKGNIFCFLMKKTFTGFFCMSKFAYLKILSIICNLLICNLVIYNLGFAQQTNNLQVIWTIPGNPILRAFGINVTHGDINNDGTPDIIISADTSVPSIGYIGRVYVYYGNHIGDTIPDVVFKSPFIKGSTPTRVASADLNGDGYDDIIIAEDQANSGYGAVTIFKGGNPPDTVSDIILRGRRPNDGFFGRAVSSGDVNGDGYKDLIVGAYGTYIPPVGDLAGRVYIYFGGPNFDTIPDVILNGGHCNDQEGFGSDIGQCADVNSDGYDDMIIGAWDFGPGRGRLYVYFGGNPMDTLADVTMMGEVPNQHLGWDAISSLRNSSNFDYAMIGTPFWPQGFPNIGNGKIYILHGGNPMDSIPDVCLIGSTNISGLAQSLSRTGFISFALSDGVISGAPMEFDNFIGSAYIWQGEPHLDTIPDAWIKGVQANEEIGWFVASAGDVDGDGRDEIMESNYAAYPPSIIKICICKYTGVGIEENYQSLTAVPLLLIVYPNPVKSVLRVSCPRVVKEMKIYDVTGKIVKIIEVRGKKQEVETLKQVQGEIRWDLRDEKQKRVANGIYFVEVTTENEQDKIREIRKIVITK